MTILLDRRTLLSGFAVGAAGLTVPPAAAAREKQPKGATFAVLGDWGRDTPEQHHVAAAMGRAAAAARSDFVLAIGDNFYSDGVASVDDPLWQSVFEGVYTHPALQVPWYALLGNHDYRGNPQAQLDYATRSKRWRMPARYYQLADAALVRADADLFAIDTSPFVGRYRDNDGLIGSNTRSQDTKAQLAWLDHALSQSRAKWKLVTGHHPIRSGGSGHGDQPEIIAQVLPILNRHGVQAYIAGHDHDLQHIRRNGIDMIQFGGGMEARPVSPVEGTRFCRAAAGFGMVQVAGDLLSFDLRDETGKSLYSAAVPVRAVV